MSHARPLARPQPVFSAFVDAIVELYCLVQSCVLFNNNVLCFAKELLFGRLISGCDFGFSVPTPTEPLAVKEPFNNARQHLTDKNSGNVIGLRSRRAPARESHKHAPESYQTPANKFIIDPLDHNKVSSHALVSRVNRASLWLVNLIGFICRSTRTTRSRWPGTCSE